MIGAGGISHTHCVGWTNLKKDCELVAITDIVPEAARGRAEEFDIARVEPNAKSLLAHKDIDVVDVVTPNRFHKHYTVQSLQAGKHVLCEKPLALTARDVGEMIAASEKSRKKLMCAQHMRFTDGGKALKEYITRHPLGDIYYARAWYNRRRGLPTTPGFMYKKNAGGGCCMDVGVHVLDLAMHLMDNFEPVSVTGISVTKIAKQKNAWTELDWGFFDKKGLDVEDFAAGIIRFADGAALTLECSFMLNQGPHRDHRIDLFGTKAGAKWPECEFYDHTSNDYIDTAIGVRKTKVKAHHAEIRAFAEAVMGNKPVPVPPRQTKAVIAVLEGLYKSAKLNREVKLRK